MKIDEELINLMLQDLSYPEQQDDNLQEKLYKKMEFYSHKLPDRPTINSYNDLKDYRDSICAREFRLLPYQEMLPNFISPSTPYKGCIVFSGVGIGKCFAKDTLVNINGNIHTIEWIWENNKTNIISETKNVKGDWSCPKRKLFVNSYDTINNKIVCGQVEFLYRQHVNENLRKIVLENGYSVCVTQNHKFFTKEGWKSKLSLNDKIYVPNTSINFPYMYHEFPTFELTILMAYMLSNHLQIDETKLNIDNVDTELIKECISIIQKQYEIRNIQQHSINFDWFDVSNIIKFLVSQKWYSKDRIPDVIMNAPIDIVRTYLQVYLNNIHFADDGLSFNFNNRIIVFQIINLLRLFNIDTHLREIYHSKCSYEQLSIYLISIANGSETKFKNEIGIEKLGYSFKYIESEDRFYKIIQIKNIPYNDYVYDLSIKDYHNFVANGIIGHNTCAAISVAEKFKEQVSKYGTKIHVLVPGPIIKESWRNQLISCTSNTYIKPLDKNVYHSSQDMEKIKKDGLSQALQYYRLLSYRSFYRKVLGEKIVEKVLDKDGIKKTIYRKTEEGDYERELSIDRIYNLNNSLLIVDEAHNLTGNAYGDAVKLIIKNSSNLKVLLLSATPMKNLADDIIFLVNLLRPEDNPMERDLVFTPEKNHEMKFTDNGKEYFRQMIKGYVSHLRGADPLVFAKRIDFGIVPKSLMFTKIVPCKMLEFQRNAYDEVIKTIDDSLDRRTEAVANFVFPYLSDDRTRLIGAYGKDGLNRVKNQLKINQSQVNNKLSIMLKSNERNLIHLTTNQKSFLGSFMSIENLENFSTKFYRALKNINKLIYGKKG